MSPKRVQLLEKIGTYPPKFVLSVSGHNAVCDSAISVSFEGIEGYTSMKIPLLHRTCESCSESMTHYANLAV